MAEHIWVYGHSFVKRLQSFIREKRSELNIDFDLNLGGTSSVRFDGSGGRSVNDLITDFDRICAARPHTVVLVIGGNDLGLPGGDVRLIARDLLAVCVRLQNAGIRVVTCRAMPRYCMPKIVGRIHGIGEGDYLKKYWRDLSEFNVYLGTYAWQLGIGYWNFNRQFSKEGVRSKFDGDGIHLNDRGQYDLYRSLRGAALSARSL